MVWNTTQSALYKPECRCAKEHRAARAEKKPNRPDNGGHKRSENVKSRGLLDDGDTLLMLMLVYILVKEQSDNSLIFALLIAMLM